MIAARLGPYEVTGSLGAGGMGEVYRATDTKLARDVAIKVLPAELAGDAERLARFEREAKLLASLNHPNIAHVYGFEGATLEGGRAVHFLAMELVEGEDLAERLKRGPIPVDEALAIAKQIAEALEEAHEHGIVHRDLKPANVKVTPDGKVKVLDFGLAKAYAGEAASGSAPDLSHSPTLAHTGTQAGVILGTAAYMSPEQARGKPVDKRADIWAFGVLFFEMLTGRRLFEGETVSDVLAAVLRQEIPWDNLPATTPAGVLGLLRRCLDRDPKRRLRDVGEAAIALGGAAPSPQPAAVAPRRPSRRGAAVLAAVTLATGGAGALLGRTTAPRPPVPPVVRLTYALPAGARLGQPPFDDVRALALSPDGSRLAFATDRIYLRPLDSLDAVEVPGTLRASNPFFAPDGAWLGFSAGGSLRKVNLAGGNPVEIAAGLSGAASWAEDGTILVASPQGVLQVPADGGAPRTLVAPETGYFYADPQLLPGGTGFLYTRVRPGGSPERELLACPIDGKSCSSVVAEARDARYVPTGQILYAASAGVTALPFEVASMRVTGTPVVVEPVNGLNIYDSYFFDVSTSSGTLVYAAATSDVVPTRLFFVSRSGGASAVPGEPRFFSDPRVSPDGRRAAVHLQDEENDVWVADLGRGTLLRLSTVPGEDETPAWSPDGRFVAWSGTRSDMARGVFRRPADGSGPEELLYTAEVHVHVNDWSPDGMTLLLQFLDPKTGPDLYTLDLESRKATPFLRTRFREHSARLSPDGRYVAYVSDESGQNEVYVQTFPEPGAKLRVSTEGGEQPVWSRDGRQIFFRDRPSVWGVRFDAGPPFSVSVPEALFTDHYDSPQVGTHTGYDVLPDGRFLMAEAPEGAAAREARARAIVFVLNFLQNVRAEARAR